MYKNWEIWLSYLNFPLHTIYCLRNKIIMWENLSSISKRIIWRSKNFKNSYIYIYPYGLWNINFCVFLNIIRLLYMTISVILGASETYSFYIQEIFYLIHCVKISIIMSKAYFGEISIRIGISFKFVSIFVFKKF